MLNPVLSTMLSTMKSMLRSDPKIAYKFIFSYGVVMIGGFSKVKSLERKVDRFTYQEGGVNNHPIILADQQKTSQKLILEKGFMRISPMRAMKGIFDAEMLLDTHIMLPGLLMVMGPDFLSPIRIFAFDFGIISEWSTSDLDAMNPTIIIESVTILHNGMIEIPL